MVVLVGLVELEHRELGIVPRRDAFVAEVAVDLEHLLEAADDEPLQVELRRDAQVELHVERVVVRHERPRRGAARDRMHHRRLDFEIAARDEELADRLHDLRALDEHVARLRIGDEVDVALPVALLLVGRGRGTSPAAAAAPSRAAASRRLDRQLAGLGLEQRARRADDVAEVPVLERVERLGADAVERDVELDAPASCPAASRSTPCPSRASASCGRRPRRATPSASSSSLLSASCAACRSAASASRRKSFGIGVALRRAAPRAWRGARR